MSQQQFKTFVAPWLRLTFATCRVIKVDREVLPDKVSNRPSNGHGVKKRTLSIQVAGIGKSDGVHNSEACEKDPDVRAEENGGRANANLEVVHLILASIDGVWEQSNDEREFKSR
jgi:hypothetical protein